MPYKVIQNRNLTSKSQHLLLSLIHIAISNSESIPDAVYGGGCKSAETIVRNAMEDYLRRAEKVVGFCSVSKFYCKMNYDFGHQEIYLSGEHLPFLEVAYENE